MAEVWDEIMTDAKLGDVSFPLRRRALSGGREFGRIRPPHMPGQRVADTGREPLMFTLEVPLWNGVEDRDDLYPTVYEELLDVCTNDDEKGEVEYIDPILGAFRVKIASFSETHDADRRDGTELEIKLEEITEDAFGIVVPPRSPGREVIEAAAALDGALGDLGIDDGQIANAFAGAGFPTTDEETLTWESGATFGGLAADFQESLSLGTVYADRVATTVDTVRARVRAVMELPELVTPQGAEAYASALRLVEAMGRQSDRAVARAVPIVQVTVGGTLSIYDLAVQLYGDAGRADEILQRNRVARPYAILAGTVLRVAQR